MRWKKNKRQEIKEKIKVIKPKIGDIKEVIKFALFPTKINNDDIIWLERYIVTYEFKEKMYRVKSQYGITYDIMYNNDWMKTEEWIKIKTSYYEK